jgi:hypothetical protein
VTTRREFVRGLLATGALALTPGGILVPEEKRRRVWQVGADFARGQSKSISFAIAYGVHIHGVQPTWAPIDVPLNITFDEIHHVPAKPVTVHMDITYAEENGSRAFVEWLNRHQHGVGPGPDRPPAIVKCAGDRCFCAQLKG